MHSTLILSQTGNRIIKIPKINLLGLYIIIHVELECVERVRIDTYFVVRILDVWTAPYEHRRPKNLFLYYIQAIQTNENLL